MEQQEKYYLHISDRPVFKLVGMVATVLSFVAGYFLFVFVLGIEDNCLISLIFPCLMVVVWESIKHRHFWILWMIGSCVCLILLSVFSGSVMVMTILVSIYWAYSLGICCWLIMACSRAEFRSREREKEGHVMEIAIDDPVKDAFLEKLFEE
ncbi:MAG: hypothetical protein IJW45_03920 [Oscillospiraceae bacterium]|nr:hypothetical protein [Oscillospiraceae bacterium]